MMNKPTHIRDTTISEKDECYKGTLERGGK